VTAPPRKTDNPQLGKARNVGCPSGKRAFRARRDAKKALRQAKARGVNVKRYYRCPRCNYFHLTSFTAEKIAKVRGQAHGPEAA
jgi:hypothetical protein